ncbi:MAG: hypothetical protein QOK34_712, partial [Gaiellaceae bacterium]|nr:hypothetical protein [Gaiellaceae bacterium]
CASRSRSRLSQLEDNGWKLEDVERVPVHDRTVASLAGYLKRQHRLLLAACLPAIDGALGPRNLCVPFALEADLPARQDFLDPFLMMLPGPIELDVSADDSP